MSHDPGVHMTVTPITEARITKRRFRSFWLGFVVLSLTLLLLALPALQLLMGVAAPETIGTLEVARLALRSAPDAPLAPNPPEDLACRPNEGKTDEVLLQWDDTNDGNADYVVYREDINNPGWNSLAMVLGVTCGNGTCQYVDGGASNNIVYRYRVRAESGGDNSAFTASCREPLVQDDPNNQFRVFYRLNECPDVDNKQVCTENITNGSGQNSHAMDWIAMHEAFRQEYMALGFKDFAFYKGAKPFPIDFFPCNNGCANSQGIQIPPAWLEETDYDPNTGSGEDYKVFVVGHEAFHKLQGSYGKVSDPYYKWLIEGQARSTEDRSCVFDTPAQCALWDDEIDKYYAGAAASYLGFPEQALLEASYNAALFWTYVMEQFGTPTNTPDSGIDAILNYWLQNEINDLATITKDGIGTLNDMLTAMGSSRRFRDVFQDFAVANYLKDYLTHPAPAGFERYNYVDEESYIANGNSYGKVKLTKSGPLMPDQPVFGTTSLQPWGARYFEVDPDPAVTAINIEIETLAATPHSLYYHVVMIDNNTIVDQYSKTGNSLSYTVDNSAGYDRIALIVASMENAVNFNYGFNLTDGIFILSPTKAIPASVGELTSPEKFILQLQVLDEVGDPVGGIDTSAFSITVGSTVLDPSAVIGSSYIGGQYWLTLRAPSNPGTCTVLCDLSVGYASYTALEEDAIIYGPKPDTDNMIIIDRSGSMLGEKIVAAQDAAKLYADSYSEGDRIGIISFNDTPNEEYALQGWEEDKRDDVALAIDNIDTPYGQTANGAALREGHATLVGQSSPNPVWSMVLLSDGADTVADTDDHIAAYVSEWKSAKNAKKQVPVVHVVAIGDDADGVELSKLTNETGGLFQFLPVPSEMASVASGDAIHDVNLAEALSEIYRLFAEDVLDEQQSYVNHFALPQPSPRTDFMQVDAAASQAIFVLKYSPADADLPTVILNSPAGGGVGGAIPPTLVGEGHLVWRIPTPDPGQWGLTLRFGCGSDCPTDYMVEAALVSDLTLKAFLGLPVEERIIGKPMPIVAFLSDIAPLTGATVTALSETTGELITLYDDGFHGDGAANDGAYGGTLLSTNLPGGYTVVIDAAGNSPFAGDYTRRARLAFYLPDAPDTDKDRLPDWWEIENCTDPFVNDAGLDPDGDGLYNSQEYTHKTNPCDADTDDGGENDGSEVGRGNNPLSPHDDGYYPPTFRPWPAPGRAILRLVLPPKLSRFVIDRAVEITPHMPGPFVTVFSGTAPINEWVDLDAANNQSYCYRVTIHEDDKSATSTVQCTTPKSDPNPPHGVVLGPGLLLPAAAGTSTSNAVPLTIRLHLDAEDDPRTEEHPPFDGAFIFLDAEISGVTEMMISNRADFEGAVWEPYQTTKMWTLEPNEANQATVFALFKDGAGNVSDVAYETFTVDPTLPTTELIDLFLPSIERP
jgi:hypothetical protein